MDNNIINEILNLLPQIDKDKLLEDYNYQYTINFAYDNNDIASLIINTSDKKKTVIERISVPEEYDNLISVTRLLETKNIPDYVKDNIMINIKMQLSKFNNVMDKKPNLLINCDIDLCKLCGNQVKVNNNNEIICMVYPDHKFNMESYCN